MSTSRYPTPASGRLWALLPPLMAWALVAVLSFAAFQHSRRDEMQDIVNRFRRARQDHTRRVVDHLDRSLKLTDHLRNYWLASEQVKPEEFASYTKFLLGGEGSGSVVALEWAARVEPGKAAVDFEQSVGFKIKRPRPGGTFEPGHSGETMFPIEYVAPGNPPNDMLLGRDLTGEELRRRTVLKAWESREPVVTPPIRLWQRPHDPTGFLYVVPIIDHNEQPEKRRHGVLVGVYSMNEIVDGFLEDAAKDKLVMRLRRNGQPHPLASAEPLIPSQYREPEKLNEDWFLDCQPLPGYVSEQRTLESWMFLVGGGIVATLLALLLWLKQNRASVLARANTLLREQIRDRERAEAALRENQRVLTTLLSNLPGAAYRARPEPERSFEFVSEGCMVLTGYRHDRLQDGDVDYLRDLVHPDDRGGFVRELETALAERRPYRLEYRIRDSAGAEKWIWEQGRPVTGPGGEILALEGFLSDVTPAKEAQLNKERMEEALRETQKLESLGILAGGIAHDFNNLLTGVLGNAEVALEMVEPSAAAREPLQQLLQAGRRARQLTAQLLAYAGRSSLESEPIDLSEHLREMVDLLQTAIPKKVNLRLHLQQGLPHVEGDPSQIQQLAMNLVLNGAEACGEGPGTVRVTTRLMEREAVTLPSGAHPDGPMVLFEVQDDGCGMDAATRRRMFDPFFTTKFAGRGLGLAAVQGIVRAHGGHLRVDSTPGRGTTVQVFLPATSKRSVELPRPPEGDLRGEGRILVVDDEPLVLDVARRILERLGYSVQACSDVEDALDWYRENRTGTRAVVLDMTMPGMSGQEMLKAMREIDPEVRAVIASGYLESEVSGDFSTEAPDAFVQKPFSRQSLGGTLKTVLGRTARKPRSEDPDGAGRPRPQ